LPSASERSGRPDARSTLSPRRCTSGPDRSRRAGRSHPLSARRGRSGASAGPIPPEKLPVAVLLDVAQASNPAGRPFGTVVGTPRRAALHNRDRVAVDDRLDADLVERVRRDSLLAVGADRGNIDRRGTGHEPHALRKSEAFARLAWRNRRRHQAVMVEQIPVAGHDGVGATGKGERHEIVVLRVPKHLRRCGWVRQQLADDPERDVKPVPLFLGDAPREVRTLQRATELLENELAQSGLESSRRQGGNSRRDGLSGCPAAADASTLASMTTRVIPSRRASRRGPRGPHARLPPGRRPQDRRPFFGCR
jgi:hypothetical protein